MEAGYFAPLSALQHLLFCERQCALIHVEGIWVENVRTVEGRQLHDRVHDEKSSEQRGGVRIARSLALVSERLGLIGVADVVEFHALDGDEDSPGALLPGTEGRWRPFPVEYKRGRPKAHRADEVQVCAQALCLEEMFNCDVRQGALFYGTTRRRADVVFDEALRRITEEAARRVHQLVAEGVTPPARPTRACKRCSLADLCLPEMTDRRNATRYLRDMLREEAG